MTCITFLFHAAYLTFDVLGCPPISTLHTETGFEPDTFRRQSYAVITTPWSYLPQNILILCNMIPKISPHSCRVGNLVPEKLDLVPLITVIGNVVTEKLRILSGGLQNKVACIVM